jgi:hypothetical protein
MQVLGLNSKKDRLTLALAWLLLAKPNRIKCRSAPGEKIYQGKERTARYHQVQELG